MLCNPTGTGVERGSSRPTGVGSGDDPPIRPDPRGWMPGDKRRSPPTRQKPEVGRPWIPRRNRIGREISIWAFWSTRPGSMVTHDLENTRSSREIAVDT
jgi:hypothetical protein